MTHNAMIPPVVSCIFLSFFLYRTCCDIRPLETSLYPFSGTLAQEMSSAPRLLSNAESAGSFFGDVAQTESTRLLEIMVFFINASAYFFSK